MDDRRIHFIHEALALADDAARMGEVPIGAVVVRGDEIIGRGHNLRETLRDPTAHAEVIALREAAATLGAWRLEGCEVYVTLEPCAMCAGAMVLARVDACVYGCTDPKGGFLGTLGNLAAWPGLNHHFEVVAGVEEAACRERLQAFFRRLRPDKPSQ
jgi:tRNA(adenine34) deaminase